MFKGISKYIRTYPAAISGFVITVLGALEAWPVHFLTPTRDGLLIAVIAPFLALFTHQLVVPSIKLNGTAPIAPLPPAAP